MDQSEASQDKISISILSTPEKIDVKMLCEELVTRIKFIGNNLSFEELFMLLVELEAREDEMFENL